MNTENKIMTSSSITPSNEKPTMNMQRVTRFCAMAAAAALVAGCGLLPATDINRVNPNYVSKDIFKGEWYAQPLVVKKQFSNAGVFEGLQGDLERLNWEITEDRLLGFRSYAKVPGAESDNVGGQTLVAAFMIESHFDIRRQYNPTNGVETNVIEENTADRPWWERDYVRIDWSKNVAPYGNPFPGMGFIWDLTEYSSMNDAVNKNASSDPTDPWRVRVSPDYIETTIDGVMRPDGNACSALGPEVFSCTSANVKIKFSFMKVDPDNDYEPLHYPDRMAQKYGAAVNPFGDINFCFEGEWGCDLNELWITYGPFGQEVCDPQYHNPDDCRQLTHSTFSQFGFFRTERFTYDRENGYTVTGREQLINRWNMWKKSQKKTGRCTYFEEIAGNNATCKSDDDCTYDELLEKYPSGASADEKVDWEVRVARFFQDEYFDPRVEQDFDGWSERSQCNKAIPFADRTPKPITYYYSVGFPESMKPATQAQADQWSEAFVDTVAELQGRTYDEVIEMYGKDGKPFRGYQVLENDCNPANIKKYIKDTEDDFDFAMALDKNGIGEIGPGNIQEACAVLEHYGMEEGVVPLFHWQQLGDLRYSFINWIATPELAGPLGYGPSSADPITGELIQGNANIYGASVDRYASYGGDIIQVLNGELTEEDLMNGSQIREHVEGVRARYAQQIPDQVGRDFAALVDERTQGMSDEEYFVEVPVSSVNANMDRIRDSGLEEEYLISEDMVRLFGHSEGDNVTAAPTQAMIDRARPSNWLRRPIPAEMRTPVFSPGAPNGTDPLAQAQVGTAGRLDKYNDYIQAMNEKGFCFFQGEVEPAVAELAYELKNKSREEAYDIIRSSIMQGVLAHEVGHTIGLRHNFEGSADALNFFPQYWGVDVGDHRDSDNTRKEELQYSTVMDYHQRFNSDFGGLGLYDRAAIKFGYGGMVEVYDESDGPFVPRGWVDAMWLFYPDDAQYLLAGGDSEQKIDDLYDVVNSDLYVTEGIEGFMDIKSIGITPRPENIFKRKNVKYVDARRDEVARFFGMPGKDGGEPAVAIEYAYCSDGFAWGGNLTCNRWDKGSSSEEIVGNAAQMYEFYYPFQAFTAQSTNPWGVVNSYLSRLQDRTYQPMRNAFTFFYYYRRSTAQIWPFFLDRSKASHTGLNFLARVVQSPDVGTYCLDGGMYVPESEADSCGTSFDIEKGAGRDYRTIYTDEYEYQPLNVGHLYDKLYALQNISSSDAFFYRDFSNQVDRSAFSIGYYRVFAPELINLYKGLIMGDFSVTAPQVRLNGTPEVVYQPLVRFRDEPYDDAAGPMIKPSSSWMLRYYGLFLSITGFSSTLDQTLDFATRARISIAGSPNDPLSVGVPEVTFTDPQSLTEYRAYAVDGPEQSVGFALLTDAKEFVENGEYADAVAAVQEVEDKVDPTQEEIDEANIMMDKAQLELADKLHIIDMVRTFTDAMGYAF